MNYSAAMAFIQSEPHSILETARSQRIAVTVNCQKAVSSALLSDTQIVQRSIADETVTKTKFWESYH